MSIEAGSQTSFEQEKEKYFIIVDRLDKILRTHADSVENRELVASLSKFIQGQTLMLSFELETILKSLQEALPNNKILIETFLESRQAIINEIKFEDKTAISQELLPTNRAELDTLDNPWD